MFEVITNKIREMAVHSKRDLDYMIAKGWSIKVKPEAVEPEKTEQKPEQKPIKKRGRPAKDK